MASGSFLLNRILLKHLGPCVIISYGPIVEEIAKTLLAYWLGADIILTHISFGVLEGVYDWLESRQGGFKPAVMSIVGHTLFGIVTLVALTVSASIWIGLASGVLFHIVYNVIVVHLYAR
jgi:hypothetical protein